MIQILSLAFFLATCVSQKYPEENFLGEMKRELAIAYNKLAKQKSYIDQLEEAIARHEIELIQKEIGTVDRKSTQLLSDEQWLAFFYQQRETLSQIIRDNRACRKEAQAVLDQILTLITQLSDQVSG